MLEFLQKWNITTYNQINSLHIHSKKEEGEPTYTPSSFNYPNPYHHEKEIIFPDSPGAI